MKLDEAINHAKSISCKNNDRCALEHQQLANWLQELKQRRESDLRPATKFVNCEMYKLIAKIREEFNEVLAALADDDKEHINEELVDLQMACETALARNGLDDQQRMGKRRYVIAKNQSRGYYNE